MQIRLTRKLANCLDGVDVTLVRVGEVIELPQFEAQLLIAERWAEPFVPPARHAGAELIAPRAYPERRHLPRPLERLREVRRGLELHQAVEREHRRAEDAFREELRESRARVIRGASTAQKSDATETPPPPDHVPA